jgi:hypothetical protein
MKDEPEGMNDELDGCDWGLSLVFSVSSFIPHPSSFIL